jgi:ribonuclease E
MKRMLINATQEEELRVAMVDGQRLYDLDIEIKSREQKKNNIYKGKISRIEPSLEAIFVDFGSERNGFLPLREISREYYLSEPIPGEKKDIKKLLEEGQEIVVQVTKEERGSKGAALTTFISLAGRFIVLMPNKASAGGISRKIMGQDREQILDSLSNIGIPKDAGLIIRTAGVGRSDIELEWDLKHLLSIWNSIKKFAINTEAPALIFKENNLIVRAMRDHLSDEISEIIVDDENTYKDAKKYLKQVTPNNLKKLSHFKETTPLFTRFQIEHQIESAYSNKVTLPSGGSVVIDYTEALVAIDINSGKSTKQSDIESTALTTNLEAVDEITRQCRLRDLGGLIVIDFIDMRQYKNQKQIENALKDAIKLDRAKISLGRISKFGLLEMSRQRLRPSLGDSAYRICVDCSGMGRIRSTESLALAVLRLVEEEARKENTTSVIADIPPDAATYLLNEKRQWIKDIEQRESVSIILIADSELSSVNFSIKRLRKDEANLSEYKKASYKLAKTIKQNNISSNTASQTIDQSNKLNPKPLSAWDIDDVQTPNLVDRFMFWLGNKQNNKIKTNQKKSKTNPRTRKSRNAAGENKRKKSTNKRRKPPAKRKTTQKQSPKKGPGKETAKKGPGKETAKKGPGKETAKKGPGKETAKKGPKKKSQKIKPIVDTGNIKEVKDHAKASEEKNKAVDISGVEKTNDKLLPWEDIVPPKTKP